MSDFVNRVSHYPIINDTLGIATSAYSSSKNYLGLTNILSYPESISCGIINRSCNVAKNNVIVKKIDESCGKYMLDKLEYYVPAVNTETNVLFGPYVDLALDKTEAFLSKYLKTEYIDKKSSKKDRKLRTLDIYNALSQEVAVKLLYLVDLMKRNIKVQEIKTGLIEYISRNLTHCIAILNNALKYIDTKSVLNKLLECANQLRLIVLKSKDNIAENISSANMKNYMEKLVMVEFLILEVINAKRSQQNAKIKSSDESDKPNTSKLPIMKVENDDKESSEGKFDELFWNRTLSPKRI